jgi:hypothetical protein
VSAERVRLHFTWWHPLVKQDLSVPQQHQRLQFALNLTAQSINPVTIIVLNESYSVLGDDCRWRHSCKDEWNETAFVTKAKFPLSLMIWGVIGVNYKSGCFFCSQAGDSEEYQKIFFECELVNEMDRRSRRFQWYFM